ncbi:hypothetical protein BS78_05G204000 [Paspalum vaginatum]|nr:hypothetical protein BS78_05G204000 [Paspalum vaginatum]
MGATSCSRSSIPNPPSPGSLGCSPCAAIPRPSLRRQEQETLEPPRPMCRSPILPHMVQSVLQIWYLSATF